MAEEAIVECRYIAADDEQDDAAVVELVSPARDSLTVAGQRMVGGTHPQADDGATEEGCEDEDVGLASGLIAGMDHGIQVQRAGQGGEGAEQMRPDINGLIVKMAQGEEGVPVGWLGSSVSGHDESVVTAPRREVIPE